MLNGQLDRLGDAHSDVGSSNQDDHSSNDTGSRSGSGSGSGLGDSSYSDSHTGTSGGRSGESEADIIASKVSKQVFWLKITVIFVLIAAAVLVAVAIYLSTQRSEVNTFEAAFHDHATKVFDTFKFNVERKLGAVDALSVAITSLAVDSNSTFPFFTVPDFEFRAANTKELADAVSIYFVPIVPDADRAGWEDHVSKNLDWIDDAIEFESSYFEEARRRLREPEYIPPHGVAKDIFRAVGDEKSVEEAEGPYYPLWQHSPVAPTTVNYNLITSKNFDGGLKTVTETSDAVIGTVWDLHDISSVFEDQLEAWIRDTDITVDDPVSKMYYPVFDTLEEDHVIAGILVSVVSWETYFAEILPPHADGVHAVLTNECDQAITFQINGEESEFLGWEDLHDTHFDYLGESAPFSDLIKPDDRRIERFTEVVLNHDYCPYTLSVYPSTTLEDDFVTNNAIIYTVCVVVIFLFTGGIFLLYDYIVERRQKLVMKRAVQSRAIVSSLFPAAVRDRLFKGDDSSNGGAKGDPNARGFKNRRGGKANDRLKNFLNDGNADGKKPAHELRPIADLFPHTTVMFADIAGFTKWSSDRDPSHVFTLLQTIYASFDKIAKKRKVFKVETIGDCYVAVTGLPDPQEDHAVRMAKFASECMKKMGEVVVKLKDTLGEDTTSLSFRVGLHSGPVTAGVLRGEKSRFQLFGNTVNTAARMESSGQKNRIQVSQETADLITEAGKGHWIYNRVDDIASRGGIQTYWVEPKSNAQETKHNNQVHARVVAQEGKATDSSNRLIEWNTDLLKRLLKEIVAHRMDKKLNSMAKGDFSVQNDDGTTVRDEIVENVDMPKFDKNAIKTKPESIQLSLDVEQQLRDYVTVIESMYRHKNPFHSFKHASNVCTNAHHLLSSIVDDDISARVNEPLTQFAVVFASLIHDVDHEGITNMQLMKEKPDLAAMYRNQSIAEQNSVDLAWNLLMDPDYEALQDAIFGDNKEFKRFRQVVVNVVMATDIFDKELNAARNARWQRAFEPNDEPVSADELETLRGTVVIEHIMQTADVMHTMQHFHSYQRWNERLFEEMHAAYEKGLSAKSPAENWYEGEIWFFDNCVLPLAKRMKDSGIFGARGNDIYRNAVSNKKDWTIKGAGIVASLVENLQKKTDEKEQADIEMQKDIAENRVEEKAKEKKKESKDKMLIEWNMDLFMRLLRQILANRMAKGITTREEGLDIIKNLSQRSAVRDQIQQMIDLPTFDKEVYRVDVDPQTIELSQVVEEQLREYIVFIAGMYKDIPFHNFKHGSAVAMAAKKYMERVSDPHMFKQFNEPVTQFATLLAALCHDVDHSGVSNAVLVKERQRVALLYSNKSVAEQNSIDLAWTVLMGTDFQDLQAAIFSNQEEYDRFKSIFINTIMATDLFDDALKADRSKRYAMAFDESSRDPRLSEEQQLNLRATTVLDLVMQVADIAHTMEHFHSFRRWNERLFEEMYQAYQHDRLDADPSEGWYSNEIKFFDEYVLPLARKINGCGMFGNAGQDLIDQAQKNRKEFVVKGSKMVAEVVQRVKEETAQAQAAK